MEHSDPWYVWVTPVRSNVHIQGSFCGCHGFTATVFEGEETTRLGVSVPSNAVKGSVTTGDSVAMWLNADGNWKYVGGGGTEVAAEVVGGRGLPGARGENDDQKCTGPSGVLCSGEWIMSGVGMALRLKVGCRADAL